MRRSYIKSGYRIGKLTVKEPTNEKKNRYTVWKCQCDCGSFINLDTRALQRGAVRNCGCETKANTYCNDLTGLRFGRLVAMYASERRAGNGTAYWHCKYDCGNEKDILSTSLVNGDTRSCGCLRSLDLEDLSENKGKIRYIEVPRKNIRPELYSKDRKE